MWAHWILRTFGPICSDSRLHRPGVHSKVRTKSLCTSPSRLYPHFNMTMSLLGRSLPTARRLLAPRLLHTSIPLRADPYPLPLDPSLHPSSSSRSEPLDPDSEKWPLPPPLDRTGEDAETMRARLVFQSRKRGMLEGDLLLSTFARDQLATMGMDEMRDFDKVSPTLSILAEMVLMWLGSCSMNLIGISIIGLLRRGSLRRDGKTRLY